MKLAQATKADASLLATILLDWIEETPWMPCVQDHAEVSRLLGDLILTGDVVTVRYLGRPMGFLARDGECIHALYLAPASRGQGHGRRLLAVAKARCTRLELWAFQQDLRARAFYAREGFQEVEQTDGSGNDVGVPDVRLVWMAEEGTA